MQRDAITTLTRAVSIGRPRSGDWARSLVGLPALVERTAGVAAVTVALIDGPVAVDHPDLATSNIRVLSGTAACRQPDSVACRHGTLVAGVLHARRDSPVLGICPDCTLLVRPIFDQAEVPVGA